MERIRRRISCVIFLISTGKKTKRGEFKILKININVLLILKKTVVFNPFQESLK